ncbi:MAG: hypothetical protein ACI88G_000364 [Woeseiaceae bacterium]
MAAKSSGLPLAENTTCLRKNVVAINPFLNALATAKK